MYTPPAFQKDELPFLYGHIEAHGFATLVTFGKDGLTASHIPMLLDRDIAPCGRLRGHFSRANPQWRDIAPEVPALAIFQGPNAYISPNWYPSKREHGKVVPTWNYSAVHATGTLNLVEDSKRLLQIVDDLSRQHEQSFPQPWQTSDAPEPYIRGQLKGIVGFEMTIDRLEGKWKMSQNRSEADRRGVIEALAASDLPAGRDVAAVMTALESDQEHTP